MDLVEVNVKARRYDSSRRRAKSEAARVAVLEAARDLLLADGYTATSLSAVAERAGVSAASVYKAFGNQPALLKAVIDYAIAGDAEPIPIIRRERAARIRSEPDPVRKLEIYADGLIGTLGRSASLHLVARSAAEIVPELAPVWQRIQDERLAGMTKLAAILDEGGHLAPGMTVDRARDILWAYTSPELYQLLVLGRGWEPASYRDWIARTLVDALLAVRLDRHVRPELPRLSEE